MAMAITSLAVAMIEPPLPALLVPAVGASPLVATGGGAAGGSAIAVSAVAMQTDPEHRVTTGANTNALPKNHFAVSRHACTPTGVDDGLGFVAS